MRSFMRNLVAMRQMKTKLRCLRPHRPYAVDFAIDARERVKLRFNRLNSGRSMIKAAFVLLRFQFQVCSTLGKQLSFFSRETQRFCLYTRNQAFAAGVRRTCTNPTCGAPRPVADGFTLQLHWCHAERMTAKCPKCAGIKEIS